MSVSLKSEVYQAQDPSPTSVSSSKNNLTQPIWFKPMPSIPRLSLFLMFLRIGQRKVWLPWLFTFPLHLSLK